MLFIIYNFDSTALPEVLLANGLSVFITFSLIGWKQALMATPSLSPHTLKHTTMPRCVVAFLLSCQCWSYYHLFSPLPIETVTWLCTNPSQLICFTKPPSVVICIATQNGQIFAEGFNLSCRNGFHFTEVCFFLHSF